MAHAGLALGKRQVSDCGDGGGGLTWAISPALRLLLSAGSYPWGVGSCIINKGPAAFLRLPMSLRHPLFSAEPSLRCVPQDSPIICCWQMSLPKAPAIGRRSRKALECYEPMSQNQSWMLAQCIAVVTNHVQKYFSKRSPPNCLMHM